MFGTLAELAYSESWPPSRPALRDSVWTKRLMRNRQGRKVPRRMARYAPNWTSRARVLVGIDSTIESRAKAGAARPIAGMAAMAAFVMSKEAAVLTTIEKGVKCERTLHCRG